MIPYSDNRCSRYFSSKTNQYAKWPANNISSSNMLGPNGNEISLFYTRESHMC